MRKKALQARMSRVILRPLLRGGQHMPDLADAENSVGVELGILLYWPCIVIDTAVL